MPYGCIDIGSNTTRLLVAECHHGRIDELGTRVAYTRLGKGLRASRSLTSEAVAATAEVVAEQVRAATDLGARAVVAVGTAPLRLAANREELVRAVRQASGLGIEVLSDEQEARLAFAGALATAGAEAERATAVVDVGGASTEIAVGTSTAGVSWWTSAQLGSGHLTDTHLVSDPPTPSELETARAEVGQVLGPVRFPPAARTLAVGGSARSLRKLVGRELSPETVAVALGTLASSPSSEVAQRFDLPAERARLLPGGALILEGLLERLASPIAVAQGGLREGVILELCKGEGVVRASRPP